MRVIVTGGAGFVGSHIAEALIGRGETVFVLDNLSTGKLSNVPKGAELIETDIRTADAQAAIEKVKPDAVFHLAAQISVLDSIRNPRHDWEVNVDGSMNVLGAALSSGCRTFINFSTGIVYGELSEAEFPVPETARKLLPFPYSRSKYEFEKRLFKSAQDLELKAASVRPGNIYGPRQDPHGEAGVIAIFSEKLVQSKPLVIHGEGGAIRDYVFISDVVSATINLFDKFSSGEFAGENPDEIALNVGTGTGTDVVSLADLLEACASKTGIEPAGREKSPARPGEVPRIVLDTSKAKRELGWSPSVNLTGGLEITFDWFRAAAQSKEPPNGLGSR